MRRLAGGMAAAAAWWVAIAASAQPAAPPTGPEPTAAGAPPGAPGDPASDGAGPTPGRKPVPGYAVVPVAPPRAAGPGEHSPVQEPREGERIAPDYDGREEEVSAGEAALWVPRVALFPAYVVSEFVVRKPLGALTVFVEENDVVGELEDAFTFGPNNNMGLVPTGFLDFGFRPSIGAYFFWNEFLDPRNDLRASVATGGERWFKGLLADRIAFGHRHYFQLELDGVQRPDLLFWGIGPSTVDAGEGSYELRTFGGGARVHLHLTGKGSFFQAWAVARAVDFDNGDCGGSREVGAVGEAPRFACGASTIFEQVQGGRYALPDGFDGYSVVKTGGRLVLDSREARPAPGSGVALDASVEHAAQLTGVRQGGWLNWGGTAAGFLDLTKTQRVVSLSLKARFAEPLAEDFVLPFTELVGSRRVDDVPDGDLLYGFRPGRLLGQSAVVAALEYRWPVWTFVDGILQTGVGNAFGPLLEDFAPELLRYSFSGGIRASNHRDHSFNLLLGFGTETFEAGADLTAVRFLFGGTTGF